MDKKGLPRFHDKYLGWNENTGPKIRDDLDLSNYKKLDFAVLEGNEELKLFKEKADKKNKTYEEVLTKKMAVQIALSKVYPGATEKENIENMLMAQSLNTGQRHYEEFYPLTPFFFRDGYEYSVENIEYAVHKVGQNLKMPVYYKAKIRGTELVETNVAEPRVVDLAKKAISVDFRECRSRELQWSAEPFLRSLFYRVLVLDPQQASAPMVN